MPANGSCNSQGRGGGGGPGRESFKLCGPPSRRARGSSLCAPKRVVEYAKGTSEIVVTVFCVWKEPILKVGRDLQDILTQEPDTKPKHAAHARGTIARETVGTPRPNRSLASLAALLLAWHLV